MINICLVSQEYPDETNFGGIATYNYYLSKGLKELGNNVIIICRSYKKDNTEVLEGIEIYRIFESDEYKYRRKVADLLKRIVIEKNIDIIESPEWGADLIEYYNLYKMQLGIPVVIKLHTPYFVWKKYNYIKSAPYIKEIEEYEKRVVCEADGIFSCSDDLKRIVAKEYSIDEKDIITIPNMISINEKKVQCNNNIYEKNTIYYIGSIEQRKGVLELAKAFLKIKEVHIEAKLYYVGRDTTRNDKGISTIKYIKSIIGQTEDVYFLNHIDNKSIFNYIKRANVMVLPSIYENFPYVVLESMLCGKAIIGSTNGGMKEILDDGKEGLLYTPLDECDLIFKIDMILSNKEFCNHIGNNARKKVEQFETKKIIGRQIHYYESIIKRHE